MKKTILNILILFYTLILFSCEEKDEPTPAVNQPPVINIAATPANLTITLGDTVKLDASTSTDPENKTLSFQWEITAQPAGSVMTLTNTTAAISFKPTHAGAYKVKVTGSDGEKTTPKEVTITVNEVAITYPQMISQNIETDVVWENINPNPGEADYIITESIDIMAKLTIKPDVIVEVKADEELYVAPNGKLIAIGTDGHEIIFTGTEKTNAFWGGITISSASDENQLDFVEINYAGSGYLTGLNNLSASLAVDGSNTAKLKISNTTIQNGGGYGLYVEDNATITGAENIEIKGNAGTSMALPINQIGNLSTNNSFAGDNGYDAIEVLGSQIANQAEITWPGFADGALYYISGDLTVRSGLKIQAGVNIEFAADRGLLVVDADAYIMAQGEAGKKITFSGKEKTIGYWKGISISSKNEKNLLDYVEVSNAGSAFSPVLSNTTASIAIDGSNLAKVSITNTIIRDGSGYGLYVEDKAVLTAFASNEFIDNDGTAMALPANEVSKLDAASKFTNGNAANVVEIIGSTLQQTEEATWTAFTDGTPYYVSGNLEVRSGLKINPGAVFEFNNDKVFIIHRNNEDAYIIAKGTAEQKIVFTGKEKVKGYWKGISIASHLDKNEFDFVEIKYGGSGYLTGLSNMVANLGLDGANAAALKMTNSTIADGKGWGMVIETGSVFNTDIDTVNTFSANEAGNFQIPN